MEYTLYSKAGIEKTVFSGESAYINDYYDGK